MHQRTQLVFLLLLIALVGVFHFALKERPDERAIADMARESARPLLWKGKVAPDFELPLRDGSTFRLAVRSGTR